MIQRLKSLLNRNQTELHALVEEREEDAAPITAHERELITNAFQFRNLDADEVSVPRSEITYLQINDSFEHILNTFQTSSYSRLPVVGEDLDDVLGFITLKDVVTFVGKEAEFNLQKSLRLPVFVPENMSLPRVLQIMKKERVQMVIVADEYSGTAGLLSLKDILEELVGEVEDEHEVVESPLFRHLTATTFWLDAKLPIEDAVKQLKIILPLADTDNADDLPYDTMGGLILHICGRVPQKGDIISIGKHSARITESDGRRVTELELTL